MFEQQTDTQTTIRLLELLASYLFTVCEHTPSHRWCLILHRVGRHHHLSLFQTSFLCHLDPFFLPVWLLVEQRARRANAIDLSKRSPSQPNILLRTLLMNAKLRQIQAGKVQYQPHWHWPYVAHDHFTASTPRPVQFIISSNVRISYHRPVFAIASAEPGFHASRATSCARPSPKAIDASPYGLYIYPPFFSPLTTTFDQWNHGHTALIRNVARPSKQSRKYV
jgi:hypothetical protein